MIHGGFAKDRSVAIRLDAEHQNLGIRIEGNTLYSGSAAHNYGIHAFGAYKPKDGFSFIDIPIDVISHIGDFEACALWINFGYMIPLECPNPWIPVGGCLGGGGGGGGGPRPGGGGGGRGPLPGGGGGGGGCPGGPIGYCPPEMEMMERATTPQERILQPDIKGK